MIEMTKQDLHLLMLHVYKFEQNASATSVNFNRACVYESTCERTVLRLFEKFCNEDENIREEEGKSFIISIIDNHKPVVGQNSREGVREISQTLDDSTATGWRHLQSIGKVKIVKKWIDSS